MVLRKGQIYHCVNSQCGAEIQVIDDSVEGVSNPRCCCGAEMKKQYETPTLRRLDPTPELVSLLGNRR